MISNILVNITNTKATDHSQASYQIIEYLRNFKYNVRYHDILLQIIVQRTRPCCLTGCLATNITFVVNE